MIIVQQQNTLLWLHVYQIWHFRDISAHFPSFWTISVTFWAKSDQIKAQKLRSPPIIQYFVKIIAQHNISDRVVYHISTFKRRKKSRILLDLVKKTRNLKIALKIFPQPFGKGIGANFFYFSTWRMNQVRKKPLLSAVTDLRFLTQLYLFRDIFLRRYISKFERVDIFKKKQTMICI